jgi:acyl-CoA reductase-like NAD-dependent aldehyde dehydrogenase
MSRGERAGLLGRTAELLRKHEAEIAEVTTDEMGSAIGQAPYAQTGPVAPVCEYYSALVRTFDFERHVVAGAPPAWSRPSRPVWWRPPSPATGR